MNNTDLNQNINTLFTNLESFTQNESLMGKPIIHENKTFIPVISVTLGYGSGNSASKAQQSQSMAGKMSGGALGMGAKLSTDAIIVIDKENVSMMPVNTMTNTSQLMDKLPQMVSSLSQNKQQGQQQGQSQQQNQAQGNQNKQQ